ncbi:hypothetical protein KQX54_018586 [Cotesia glomerata]|uniref:Uncharacterized protein n=1 Tax=Cotesia glomerata TaxID=32391 RepID=A0AAV7I404_COTGL|nr:hypothetical protein KQX54_018586 [Cotesia glomerata]
MQVIDYRMEARLIDIRSGRRGSNRTSELDPIESNISSISSCKLEFVKGIQDTRIPNKNNRSVQATFTQLGHRKLNTSKYKGIEDTVALDVESTPEIMLVIYSQVFQLELVCSHT